MTTASYSLCRLYVCLSVLVSAFIAVTSPYSLQHAAFSSDPTGAAWLLVALMATCAAFGVADVLLNDGGSARPRAPWLVEWRWLLYCGLGALLIATMAVAAMRAHATPLVGRYSLDATMAVTVAWLDVRARHGSMFPHAAKGARRMAGRVLLSAAVIGNLVRSMARGSAL